MLDETAETEGLTQQAFAKRTQLMVLAAQAIAPLKDAVDLDLATDDEKNLYDAWRHYRVDLNRIEQQPGFPREIDWPLMPSQKSKMPG